MKNDVDFVKNKNMRSLSCVVLLSMISFTLSQIRPTDKQTQLTNDRYFVIEYFLLLKKRSESECPQKWIRIGVIVVAVVYAVWECFFGVKWVAVVVVVVDYGHQS